MRPYRPIAVGFYLLSLPLWLAVFLAGDRTGRWTNGLAAALFLALGFLLDRKRR